MKGLRKRHGRRGPTTVKMVEGVPYRPYLVCFTTESGRRVRATIWSPGAPWLGGEVQRYLAERGDVDRAAQVVVQKKGW